MNWSCELNTLKRGDTLASGVSMFKTKLSLRWARIAVLLGFLACFSVESASALNPERNISQYGHTVWRVQEGYLGAPPTSFAQTPDGYLWVGTEAGLYRFNGVSFVAWDPPAQKKVLIGNTLIRALYAARDGSLWVGYGRKIVNLVNGEFKTIINIGDGGLVRDIAEDTDGGIWFTRTNMDRYTGPLCKVVQGSTRCYGEADGIKALVADSITIDKQGHLWVGAGGTLIEWKEKLIHEFPLVGVQSSDAGRRIQALALDGGGTVWTGVAAIGLNDGLQRFINGKWELYTAPGLDGASFGVSALMLDRDVCLWVGTTHQGLYRIHGDATDHYEQNDGLSSNDVTKIFQDHEGGIWVATNQGIDHFYDIPVVSYSNSQGLGGEAVNSVLALRDGSVAVTSRGSLYSIRGSRVTSILSMTAANASLSSCILEDHNGDLWMCTHQGSIVMQLKHQLRVIIPATVNRSFQSLAEDTDHSIWAVSAGVQPKLFRIENYQVREEFGPPQFVHPTAVIADPKGGIWLSLLGEQLMHYRKGLWQDVSLTSFKQRYGQHGGIFNMTYDASGMFWGATREGIFAYKEGKVQLLNDRNGLPCNNFNSVVTDIHEALWIQASCGLIKIERSEVDHWWAAPESKIKFSNYTAIEGFRAGASVGRPAATRSSDGKLWFQNQNLVMMVDPNQLASNLILPPVHIEQVIADRTLYPAQNGLRLPIKTRQLEFDYTALSFVMPSKVNFRYRLEGHDTQWQEPGTRRAAFYNDLPPGHYTFRVIASNNSGLWNTEGESLQFSIPPAFYQTNWFRALCVLAFFASLWLLYQLRLRQLRQEFNIGLESRVQERTRIARDLHDTLLQSVHALLLRLQTVSNVLPSQPDEAKRRIDRVIEQTSSAVTEGRDTLNELRASASMIDLDQAVTNFAQEILSNSPPDVVPEIHVRVEGTPRSLNPIVRDEIYRIVTEAVRNAIEHANAARIEVQILYQEHHLRLRIGDNGTGIDPAILDQNHKPGHWGLRGMRERAKLVGGTFEVWSKVGSGTDIELSIPAASVYETPLFGHRSFLSRFRRS
jgi:signal transduction histidine kinase/ligand-binding sensor domain-containing protein